MPRPKKAAATPASAEKQVTGLIAKLTPGSQVLVKSLRRTLQKRFPTAHELVYDYTGNLVISFSPTEAGIDAIVCVSATSKGVSLIFTQGASLPDPHRILEGTGKMNRSVPAGSAAILRRPEIDALLKAAVSKARVKLRRSGKGELIVKKSSAKKG